MDWRKVFDEKFYQTKEGVWMSRAGENYGSVSLQMGRGELFRFIESVVRSNASSDEGAAQTH